MSDGKRHAFSRRKFIKSTATSAAAITLASPALMRRANAQGGQLVFASNGGQNQTVFEEKFIPKFTEQTGIEITYVPGGSASFVAKMRAAPGATGFDVVWLGGATPYVAASEGLLDDFDPELTPNAQLIRSKHVREPNLLQIGAAGNCLIYSKPVYEENGWEPPTEWWALWDERLAGHTGMYGMNSTGGLEMLLQISQMMTGDYMTIDPALEKFRELRKTIYEFFPSAGAWETALQQGELWLGANSYTRAIQLTNAGMPIGSVLPESGIASHILALAIPKGSQNYEAANKWANFLLAPENQQMVMEDLGFSPTVEGIEIPAHLQSFIPSPELEWFPDWRAVSERFDEIVDRWQREVER